MWPLDARELAAWWERYDRAKDKFVRGFITRIEAVDELMRLRYRDDALRAEIKVWDQARERFERDKSALKHKLWLDDAHQARREKELENDARDVAASSSE